MKEKLGKLQDKMDIDRTDEIFDSVIKSSGIKNHSEMDDAQIKKMKMVMSAGNLHVRTAQIIIGAARLLGYYDNMQRLKYTVQKRARKAQRAVR